MSGFHIGHPKGLISLIILLGIALRCYNLNFPSIGYHNMKENEYLSIAENMRRGGNFISRKIYFYNAFEPDTEMKLFPQPPLVSYQILASWKLLGENLWGPRLLNALFGAFSILVIYGIALLLFQDLLPSLFCAFLLAIMPLAVFFSRNLQPEGPGLFFMLLGNLFYLKFAYRQGKRYLILGGLAFFIAWLYKFSFILGILPFVFLLSFRYLFKNRKIVLKYIFPFIIPYVFVFLTIIWLRHIGQWQFDSKMTLARIKVFELFSVRYWRLNWWVIWEYLQGENFTLLFVFLAIAGAAFALARKKGITERYIIGWSVMTVPYAMIFSDFINKHNYYQMPFLGLVCISVTYALFLIAEKLRQVLKKELTVLLMALVMILSAPSIYQGIFRMYARFFPGVDVAGKSLNRLTGPQERVFLLAHCQAQGIARYAQRYAGWPADLADFKEKEHKFGVRYICIYPWHYFKYIRKDTPETFAYIQENYHLKELGFLKGQEPVYFILEKGKGQDLDKLFQNFSAPAQLRAIYQLPGRRVFFCTARLETNK